MTMERDPTIPLTTPVPSGNVAGEGKDVMCPGEESNPRWSKRGNWAKCREPYKTEFDTLASHWIEGELSNEKLALELWEMAETLLFVEAPTKLIGTQGSLPDVHLELNIVVTAMLSANLYPANTPCTRDERLDLLEQARRRLTAEHGTGR